MNRRNLRATLANRIVFVGCQYCGRTDMPLRNYGNGKICPVCMKKKNVPNLGTVKEK